MRSYECSGGSDEPARLQKFVRALTPYIHMEIIKVKMHA